jgi:general stress protein 26
MTNELIKKAEEFLAKSEINAISSIDENGYPRTAAMCSLKTEGINTVWFSTGTNSHKVKNFIRSSKASVCYNDGNNNVTLIGDISIVDDIKIKTELWVDWFIKHFPLGTLDPNYCVLKFETKYMQAYIDDEFDEIIIR